ncbi:Fic family protein [Bifidobacterium samirii]|uniref:Cell filamentation protein Fic n=1 Tax=Bifidobacterium samirii TaxID=2306974 RepID=A0A430FWC6_9BIFI|nr:Fic family protein [Bifidobacterium samirii]RSX58488.1 cell filamentation protein Fic [Bifidobacterium samirii]
MHHFDYRTAADTLITPQTTRLLTAIHEAKGRQSTRIALQPDIVKTLVSVARIQSTDASNRIEGIATSDRRLGELVMEKTTPRNRDEEEIAGYRDVLALIHESHDYIPLTPNVILQLHRDLFRHTPLVFGGRFKDTDNVIVERMGDGTQSVRFTPPSALATPELVEQACTAYRDATTGGDPTDPLLATAMFVFDFTCIHPFNDGNGRMSRLLTLLLMYRSGFDVGKYVSIEHIIEHTKDTYYDALAASTRGWNEDANDYGPFVRYLLGTVLSAYRDFDERVGAITSSAGPAGNAPSAGAATKEGRIIALFDRTLAPIAKSDILRELPDISETTVERTLRKLLAVDDIIKVGAGRSTRYIRRR